MSPDDSPTNARHDTRWNQRRFVSLGVLFCGLTLPVTGLCNHLARHANGPRVGGEWVVAHVTMGALFVALVTWHVTLNRRALAKYLRHRTDLRALLSGEALTALVVVAGVLALALTAATAAS